jgi:hypothetical protein
MTNSTAFGILRENVQNFVFPPPEEKATKMVKAECDEQVAPNFKKADPSSVIVNSPTKDAVPSGISKAMPSTTSVRILTTKGNCPRLEDLCAPEEMSLKHRKATSLESSDNGTLVSCSQKVDESILILPKGDQDFKTI